jgi:hypothetical protein
MRFCQCPQALNGKKRNVLSFLSMKQWYNSEQHARNDARHTIAVEQSGLGMWTLRWLFQRVTLSGYFILPSF